MPELQNDFPQVLYSEVHWANREMPQLQGEVGSSSQRLNSLNTYLISYASNKFAVIVK